MSGTIVFLHAHPDDEAIFTGGTIARLTATGWRVVLIFATGGERGEAVADNGGGPGEPRLGELRRTETLRAAELLGVVAVDFLGYIDSGMPGETSNEDPDCLWQADVAEVGSKVAGVLVREAATALVIYDEFGVYGHPDHIAVHRAGLVAVTEAGTPTVYESTVDREYLHFVETHLVEEAILATDLGLVRSHLGVPTVLITTIVDVRDQLEVKRAAMAAHGSQIPETTSALQLGMDHFAEVYGYEWYVRSGPKGPLDSL